jgi:hypothetical protein
MVPYLESPAPFDDCSPRERKKHQRKRLSFHLLYDGNEDNLNRGDDEDHLQKSEITNNSSNPQMMQNSNQCQDSNSAANGANGTSEPEQDHHVESENSDEKEKEESYPLKTDASPQRKSEKKIHVNSTIVDTAASVVANETNKGQLKFKRDEDSSEKLERSDTSLDKDQPKKNKSSHAAATTNSNQQQQQQQQAGQDSASSMNAGSSHSASATTSTSTAATAGLLQPLLLSKDKRSKWLDHLNSFQESNHDVDVQMQEFIKVPGSVEKTLSFGLLICIDSFLYVCTILPIRFAWSCVLLSLHYFSKWTKKPAGNYQFHRRYVC